MHALPAKVAAAAHHLHLDTLPTLPFDSARACTMDHHWIGLVTSHGKSLPWWPRLYGMVWYAMGHCYSGVLCDQSNDVIFNDLEWPLKVTTLFNFK